MTAIVIGLIAFVLYVRFAVKRLEKELYNTDGPPKKKCRCNHDA